MRSFYYLLFLQLLLLFLFIGQCRCSEQIPDYQNDLVNETKYYIHFICHTHLDLGWVKTINTYYTMFVKFILFNLPIALNQNVNRKFHWSEIGFLEKYWNTDATVDWKNNFTKLVYDGKIEFVGGGYVQSDEACTRAESYTMNIENGNRFIVKNFGEDYLPQTAWQIDPFGYSTKAAKLEAYSNRKNIVLHRVDEALRAKLALQRDLNFLWRSNLQDSSELFVTVLDNGYTWPTSNSLPIDSTSNNISTLYNTIKQTIDSKIRSSRTPHILMIVGGDFVFYNPEDAYNKIDQMIEYCNKNSSLQAQYSTFNEYITSVKQYYINNKTPIKLLYDNDLFQYFQADQSYWVGYYTSKPNLKKDINCAIQQTFLSEVALAYLYGSYNPNMSAILFDTINNSTLLTHHDAITGTCTNDVWMDYNSRIQSVMNQTSTILTYSINLMYNSKIAKHISHNFLNPNTTETRYRRIVLMNPNHWTKSQIVSVRINSTTLDSFCPFSVYTGSNESLIVDCEYNSTGLYYTIEFLVTLGPWSTANFFIKRINVSSPLSNFKVTIDNPYYFNTPNYQIVLSNENRMLQRIIVMKTSTEIQLNQTFILYNSSFSDGAYVFKPWVAGTKISSENSTATTIIGALSSKYIVNFSNDLIYQMKMYTTGNSFLDNNIDFEYNLTVPLNTDYAVRFNTNINNTNIYSDDGMELKVRKILNQMDQDQPQKAYYPSVTSAAIFDSTRSLVFFKDRSCGAAGLGTGIIEFGLHRSSQYDDFKGLDEPPIDTTRAYIRHRMSVQDSSTLFNNYWKHSRDFLNRFEVFDLGTYYNQPFTGYIHKPVANFDDTPFKILSYKRNSENEYFVTVYNSSPNKNDTCFLDVVSLFRSAYIKQVDKVFISGYGNYEKRISLCNGTTPMNCSWNNTILGYPTPPRPPAPNTFYEDNSDHEDIEDHIMILCPGEIVSFKLYTG